MGKVIFFSGAGISADSGLGVFRGSGGLWNKYDINKVCNFHTWLDNYSLVHEFYNKRRLEYAKVHPNPMHKVIASLQQQYSSKKVIAITQNVDDLLERAGCKDVLHVHGRINFIHCTQCGFEFETQTEFIGGQCQHCGGKTFKPSVVFFGEQAPAYAPMYEIINSLSELDMIAVIGTEGSVVPISAILGTKTTGVKGFRFLCNLEPSPFIDACHFHKVMYERAQSAAPVLAEFAEKILKGEKPYE